MVLEKRRDYHLFAYYCCKNSTRSYRTRQSSSQSQRLLEEVVLWTLRRTIRVAPPHSLLTLLSSSYLFFFVSFQCPPELWTLQFTVPKCFLCSPKVPVKTSVYFCLVHLAHSFG